MPYFVYDPSNIIARDTALGLTVDRDWRYREETPPGLVFTDTVSGQSWICPIAYERERRPDLTSDTPRTYLAEVACRISRRYVAMLAEGVAEVKAAQGHDISPEVMAGRLLIGAVVYVTAGGSLMAQIPDFRFIFTDEWPNPL